MKRIPWAIPTMRTISGISQMYFKGIAIQSKTKNEIASNVLMILNVFIEVSTSKKFSAKIE